MSIFRRLRAWWSKDDVETAEEETRMTPAEREVADEDFEARKDDIRVENNRLGLGAADYESDSEPPR